MFEQKYRQIGAKITYFRKIRRYTQEELAFRASISASYLSRIERGAYVSGVPLSTLMRIALALEVDINRFFDED
ncbi:MAG TPA: helix-turn-helix domain-containing protein [Phascolarctobacterium faecium]|uniref:helix-turn-helix domain-containing protein n=1 Tax=Phascolarctobacterium faecium TaxID=33025 RepID=UPI002432D918|nr:helix-turn-helix transcriptional regulator [Phascolarctobacterium faecium]HJI09617.1 helix-turn-helix domain-containing protein [Phascolarctobacterium faecium]